MEEDDDDFYGGGSHPQAGAVAHANQNEAPQVKTEQMDTGGDEEEEEDDDDVRTFHAKAGPTCMLIRYIGLSNHFRQPRRQGGAQVGSLQPLLFSFGTPPNSDTADLKCVLLLLKIRQQRPKPKPSSRQPLQ